MGNFIGIGGGEIPGWSFKTKDDNQVLYQTKEIDEYIVNLSESKKPNLLFIGLASKENKYYFNSIKNIYEKLGCSVSNLEILDFLNETTEDGFNIKNKYYQFETRIDEICQKIFSADIIYIGGGKTKFLLEILKKMKIDKMLIDAYNRGIVIAGFSAGCYSFFKYNYELINGFEIINGISCVHYDEKSEEKKMEFYETIKNKNLPGISLDNGVAIHYFDNKFKIIKSIKTAKAYLIKFENDEFIKKELEENIEYEM